MIKTQIQYYFIFLFLIVAQQLAGQDSINVKRRPAFFKISDSSHLSARDYALRIEEAFFILNQIQPQVAVNKFSTESETINNTAVIVGLIDTSFKFNATINPKDLKLYLKLLENAEENIRSAQAKVKSREEKYRNARSGINIIAKDSLIIHVTSTADSITLEKLYPLKFKWLQTDSMITKGFTLLDSESVKLVSLAIKIEELKKIVNSKLVEVSIETFGVDIKEKTVTIADNAKNVKDITKINARMFGFYVAHNLFHLFWLPLFLVLILYRWVWKKYKEVKLWQNWRQLELEQFNYINRNRFLSIVLLIFSLIPLFDIFAPSAYFFLIQVTSIVLFFLLLQSENKRLFKNYFVITCSVFMAIIIASTITQGLIQKILLITVNSVAVISSLKLFRETRLSTRFTKPAGYIALLYGVLNLISLLLILTGRVSLAHSVSFAAVAGLIQVLCLLIAKEIFFEMIKLQLIQKRLKYKVNPRFNSDKVFQNLQSPLNILITLLCLMVFTTNVNLYTFFRDALTFIFALPIILGSISIKVGSVILFIIVITISHFLKKHIGYVFGDIGTEDDDEDNGKVEQSGLVIARLVIICIGYLIAVAASGLPVDKITIVLGALSVGIGLGLQNIVNNFVSGIILLFDRPFKIGDNVIINSKSGKVKGVGIRTSTLFTEDGAEVIIPNGSILGQEITNWSFSDNRRRIELIYVLGTEQDKTVVGDQIKQVIANTGFAIIHPKPAVFLENITEKELKFRITFWCKDSNVLETVKSEMRYQLYVYFRDNNIQIKA